MLTYEKVIEVFEDYLKQEACIEIAQTKWGYLRVFYEEPYDSSFEATLCKTPEELFQELLESALASQEYQLLHKEQRPEDEVAEELECMRKHYQEKVQRQA